MSSLSVHDNLILESIFNPNQPFGDRAAADQSTPASNEILNATSSSSEEWKGLEKNGIEAAERGDLKESLEFFERAVTLEPRNAASYNNRAQLHRLAGDVAAAKGDLDTALEMSMGRGDAAMQAYSQRAMIKHMEGDEAGCRSDFQKAADLGSKFAKRQLVALNPYAALCNSMLQEMVTKLQRGEPENNGDPAA